MAQALVKDGPLERCTKHRSKLLKFSKHIANKRFAALWSCASFEVVDVVLRKLGRKGGRVVAGRLVRAPRAGSVVVIEFPDGLHEYVTTPVKRVLRLVGGDVFFLQTANSCYRLEVRSGDQTMLDSIAK